MPQGFSLEKEKEKSKVLLRKKLSKESWGYFLFSR